MFKLKVLDRYILKSFLKPFLATFFIILFILVMQVLWKAFESFAGKGITPFIILKFLWYTLLVIAPQAFPIGVLLSSIMCLGNLAEKYEFAAIKSAGISLQRLVRPLVILTLFLSLLNFLCLNYVYPYAMHKQLNLRINIKHKQPSLALVAGGFNTEIPNFQIKFDEKYGENGNFLKNVVIYDLSKRQGNNKIITAEKGEIISKKGSRYMTLKLEKGHFFEHHITDNYKKKKRMPASYADFDEYTINVDVSKFLEDNLDEERYNRNYNMLSLKQLKDTLPAMKVDYDEFIKNRARNLALDVGANKLFHSDSIPKKIVQPFLCNFEDKTQIEILEDASDKVTRRLSNIYSDSSKSRFKRERKVLNLYDNEFYNRIALSLACLLLFFIGAPLGSIIKKGGMGMPMVFAILIYVTYHFSNTFGKNMAEESTITSFVGSWIATLLMTPLAIFLTVRATKDKSVGSINLLKNITKFFKKLFIKQEVK